MNKPAKLQFKIIPSDEYITLKLEGQLMPDSIPAFLDSFPEIVKPTHHIIVQCSNLSEVTLHWVRPLLSLEKEITTLNKKIRFIEVNDKVAAFFQAQGVDGALIIRKDLKQALSDMKIAVKKVLDTDFINPFLDSTVKVLEVQSKTKASAGKIYVKKPGEKFSGDISGVIGLVSDAFTGSVVISLPEKTFLAIMSRMMGEELKELTRELEDGAAELTNIIFGQAKIILNEKGYGIKTALPSVITGKDHSVASTVKGITVVVPFTSDAGDFFIEICTSV